MPSDPTPDITRRLAEAKDRVVEAAKFRVGEGIGMPVLRAAVGDLLTIEAEAKGEGASNET